MDYEHWLERERRIRLKILKSSPYIRETHQYRVCRACDEICLCHEDVCPNCGGDRVAEAKMNMVTDDDVIGFIRCKKRFYNLNKE